MRRHLKIAERFIDPTSDFGFKKIFGTETDKKLLINFLNGLLRGRKCITDISYGPNEHIAGKDSKKVVFDLFCTASDGEQFIIEMQNLDMDNFIDRCLFYASRVINQQVKVGRRSTDYKLHEVIVVAVLNFKLQQPDAFHYLNEYGITNKFTGQLLSDKLAFIFVELPKFVKPLTECLTDLDQWLYLLKNLSAMRHIPAALNKGIFKDVFELAEIKNLTMDEFALHNLSTLLYKTDMKNIRSRQRTIAREEGLEEGKAAGLKQGLQQGLQEGRKEGRKRGLKEGRNAGLKEGIEKGKEQGLAEGNRLGLAEGKKQGLAEAEKQRIALIRTYAARMKEKNTPAEEIAEITGLPIAEIGKL